MATMLEDKVASMVENLTHERVQEEATSIAEGQRDNWEHLVAELGVEEEVLKTWISATITNYSFAIRAEVQSSAAAIDAKQAEEALMNFFQSKEAKSKVAMEGGYVLIELDWNAYDIRLNSMEN